jgi:hypothetical protein
LVGTFGEWEEEMAGSSDQDRRDRVVGALGNALSRSYPKGSFQVRAFEESEGYVRGGAYMYVPAMGDFLIASVHPPEGKPFGFLVQREDVLDEDRFKYILGHVERTDFTQYERMEGDCHQFFPQRGSSPGHHRSWICGELQR